MIKIGTPASETNPSVSNDNPRETASSTESKRNSIAVSNNKNNLVKVLPPLDSNNDLEDLEGLRYDDAKKLRDRQNALERK